jgi:hypothetical protein
MTERYFYGLRGRPPGPGATPSIPHEYILPEAIESEAQYESPRQARANPQDTRHGMLIFTHVLSADDIRRFDLRNLNIIRCPHCRTDLSVSESVMREYEHKTEGEASVFAEGFYDAHAGHFESEVFGGFDDGTSLYDQRDDSDTCMSCEGAL